MPVPLTLASDCDGTDDPLYGKETLTSLKAGDQVTLKVYVAASGGYVTQTATLLEDESTSSYSTEQPATSQLNPFKQQSGPPTTSAAD